MQTENTFTLTDDSTQEWKPQRSGFFEILVGSGGSPNFASANVSVRQHGIDFDSMTGITSATRQRVYATGGAPIEFVPSGAVTSVEIRIHSAPF